MNKLDHVLILNEGVPFGDRYGIFYYKDGTVSCLDWEDSIMHINSLSKKIRKNDDLLQKLNVQYADLNKLEHPDKNHFSFNKEFHNMINEANKKTEDKYTNETSQLEIYKLSSMYYYDKYDDTESNKKIYEDYRKIKNNILNICNKEKIDYEKDDSIIMNNIINTFQKYNSSNNDCRINYVEDVSDCIDEEKIINTFNEKKKKGLNDLKQTNYYNKKMRLVDYTSRYLQKDYKLAQALENKKLFNRKDILKEWAEFLIVLPKYCSILNILDKCDNAIHEIELSQQLDEFHNNTKFINDLNEILKRDNDEEYYLHATSSENIDSILKNGFFSGSPDLYSTAVQVQSNITKDQVLSYSYGGGASLADGAIVVIRKPANENIVRKSTKEEQENCNPVARRFLATTSMNQYIIDKKYIVGIIDKKNKKVYNNKNSNDLDRMFEINTNNNENSTKGK